MEPVLNLIQECSFFNQTAPFPRKSYSSDISPDMHSGGIRFSWEGLGEKNEF